MNITEFLRTISIVDVLIIIGLFGCFILGWVQGTIRRLIGIGSMTFSFFLAAVLHVPLGRFLAENWTQFPPEYSVMLGFLMLFVAAVIAFSLVIQGTYQKTEIFAKHPIVDEILGGVLGVVQGFLLLMFVTIILDQFFLYTNIPPDLERAAVPAAASGRRSTARRQGRCCTRPSSRPSWASSRSSCRRASWPSTGSR